MVALYQAGGRSQQKRTWGGHGLAGCDLTSGTVRRALTDAGQNRFTVPLPRRDNPDATATLRTHDASKIRGVVYLLSPFTDGPPHGGAGR
jgi:hypothetical protein